MASAATRGRATLMTMGGRCAPAVSNSTAFWYVLLWTALPFVLTTIGAAFSARREPARARS